MRLSDGAPAAPGLPAGGALGRWSMTATPGWETLDPEPLKTAYPLRTGAYPLLPRSFWYSLSSS